MMYRILDVVLNDFINNTFFLYTQYENPDTGRTLKNCENIGLQVLFEKLNA